MSITLTLIGQSIAFFVFDLADDHFDHSAKISSVHHVRMLFQDVLHVTDCHRTGKQFLSPPSELSTIVVPVQQIIR
mgnify:CR=1 FL=1